jgi:DNA polymerase elongation subunit (family B)
MKVVYGHTDSIYVQMPMERADETLALLNTHVRSKFPNLLGLKEHPVNLEFEKYYKSLGVGVTKNRNAGLIIWKDGITLDAPEFVMTGFSAKRASITALAKDIQLEVLKMWVSEKSEFEISTWLNEKYNDVISGKIDIDMLINRSRFRQERLTYKCIDCNKQYTWEEVVEMRLKQDTSTNFCSKCGQDLELVTLGGKKPSISAGVEGLIWNNQINKNKIDDSYYYMRVLDDPTRRAYMNPITGKYKRPTYISAENKETLMEHTPDYKHYASSVIKKAEPIFNAMNWSTQVIERDRNQKGLGEWF